jgi:hypothetical protein
MALLFGILLAPVGALIGSVLLVAVMSLLPAGGRPSGNEWLGVAQFDFVVGLIFAAPVTVVMLPLTYALLQRTRSLSLARLTIAGACFGFASVWAVVLWLWGPNTVLAGLEPVDPILLIAVDGALTGAVCGNLLGRLMRRFRGAHWQVQPAGTQA